MDDKKCNKMKIIVITAIILLFCTNYTYSEELLKLDAKLEGKVSENKIILKIELLSSQDFRGTITCSSEKLEIIDPHIHASESQGVSRGHIELKGKFKSIINRPVHLKERSSGICSVKIKVSGIHGGIKTDSKKIDINRELKFFIGKDESNLQDDTIGSCIYNNDYAVFGDFTKRFKEVEEEYIISAYREIFENDLNTKETELVKKYQMVPMGSEEKELLGKSACYYFILRKDYPRVKKILKNLSVKDPEIINLIAFHNYFNGEYKTAGDILKNYIDTGDYSREFEKYLLLNLGITQFYSGNIKQGRETLETCLKKYPNFHRLESFLKKE